MSLTSSASAPLYLQHSRGVGGSNSPFGEDGSVGITSYFDFTAKSKSDASSSVTEPSPGTRASPAIKHSPRRPHLRFNSDPLSLQQRSYNLCIPANVEEGKVVPNTVTAQEDLIHVRTDQTPLRGPKHNVAIIPQGHHPRGSYVTVENDFTALPIDGSRVKKLSFGRRASESATRGQTGSYTGTRRTSFNPMRFFSAPLHTLRRRTSSKAHPIATVFSEGSSPVVDRQPRLRDHGSEIKRGYTAEALQRVTTLLQDLRMNSEESIKTLGHYKKQRPLWRTVTEKIALKPTNKGEKTTDGIISGLGMKPRAGSGEQGSDPRSYTSSQVMLRMGGVPGNTPWEGATYKVKRSPSAETEEFLKVDVSIRGGTSYLPSEARRIHTPPAPEEGVDGNYRGFFFDYNPPRTPRIAPQLPILGILEPELMAGGANPDNHPPTHVNDRGFLATPRTPRPRTKSGKRVLTGDWNDVQLAKVDMDLETNHEELVVVKNSSRRLDCTEILSKITKQNNVEYDGEEVEPDTFDMTIPEHYPSSPLCPRHPRYWRVLKHKGSHFRGCWMHGVGLWDPVTKKPIEEKEPEG
jgi:hypothetical protein